MELTKQAIKDHASRISGLEGYGLIVSTIEKNTDVHPDIAIESCKSLIEGLCKKALEQVSEEYQDSKQLRTRCDSHLPTLVKTAFDQVFIRGIEANLHYSLYELIKNKNRVDKIVAKAKENVFVKTKDAVNKIVALRDSRGDISHGRMYPKEVESEIQLARSVASITDGICSYMIHHLSQQIKAPSLVSKVDYEERKEYNNWLDAKANFEQAKVKLSVMLYEVNYSKYEEIYETDYVTAISESDVDLEERTVDYYVPTIEVPTPQEGKEVLESAYTEPKVLVSSFSEGSFWTAERLAKLREFCEEKGLKDERAQEVISDYLYTRMEPTRDQLGDITISPISILSKKEVQNEIISALMGLIVILEGMPNE